MEKEEDSVCAGGVGGGSSVVGMGYRVVFEYDSVARAYSAVCPELPGCASVGDSLDAARRNIEEAIALYLA